MANPKCPVCREEMDTVEPPILEKEQLAALMQSRIGVYVCNNEKCKFRGVPRYLR